jgi:hypothetical protein
VFKRIARRIKKDNENGARISVLEELFYDFHRKRHEVYWMNFVRGLFFGVGSALGATVVIALLAWLLNLFTDLPGGIGHFVQDILNAMNQSR